MWWDAPVLLLAVAAGALIVAVLAILRPALLGALPPWLVWVAAAAGAVVIGLSEAAPTGWSALDLLLRVGFGAVVPLAAARAGSIPTSWLLVVSVAVLLVSDAPAATVAAVACGAFLSSMAAGTTTPAVAAIASAAGIGALAHADWPLTTGASAVAVAVAAVPVVVASWLGAERRLGNRIAVAALLVIVVLGLGAVAGLVAALQARDDVEAAVDLATTGLDQLGDDDDEARRNLRDAAAAFAGAESDLRSWWARSALLVPGVAQQSRAVSTMASAGADLARTAADATEDADIDAVRPNGGRIDLAALAALEDPLRRSLVALQRAEQRLADVDSPLLVGPVAARLRELQAEVNGAVGSAELAARAVELAPRMLGADGPRRYFVAFQNPAELTGNGGFMGNWAEVVTDDGQLLLTRSGRNRELTEAGPDPEARTIEGEEEFLENYPYDPARYWGNINLTPDHPTVGRITAQLYPQSGGAEVDGVIAITPTAMAALLELTGPIAVPGYDEELTSENAERILLHEQYLRFPEQADDDREQFLADSVEQLFDQLTSGELPGPRAIAEELSPAVDSGHLRLWSAHEEEQALFDRMGATGAASRDSVDSFGVVTQNLNGNKIDWFLHREVSYDVVWDPEDGSVSGTITAAIRNEAPAGGLPPSVIGWGGDEVLGQRPVADGENFMQVALFASHPIERVTLDGEPVEFTRGEELGHHTARIYLSVPSQSGRTVAAKVRGVVAPTTRYVVRPIRQPTVNPDSLEVRLRIADGWRVDAVRGAAASDDGREAVTREDAPQTSRITVGVHRREDHSTWLGRLRGTR